MEKYSLEVPKEMKTSELSLVSGLAIVTSGDPEPDGLLICCSHATAGHTS